MKTASDVFTLNITAAFRTPQDNVYYVIDDRLPFRYMMYRGGRYYTKAHLRPKILQWLFNSNLAKLDLWGDGRQILERVPFEEEMTVEVFYSSLHHISKR